MARLTIATINIYADLSLWERRRTLLADGLAALSPDLIAVQEAELRQDTARWLAAQLGMEHIHLTPKTGNWRHEEGLAILSRLPFQRRAELDLITQDRVTQYVQVSVDGRPLGLANAQLYWMPGESPKRVQQVERLLNWLREIPGNPPLVVAGDFNATPDMPSILRMEEEFVSAYRAVHGREPDYTTPTPLPRSRGFLLKSMVRLLKYIELSRLRLARRVTLDYIFVDRRLHVLDSQVILNRPAAEDARLYPSDHFGISAVIEL